jgi:glycosyltransferase involved in cell wall biosynthesis
MIKFAIIIPFRPKAQSVDWERESNLLQRTIQSVLRQSYSAMKVFVTYTDAPSVIVADERVEYHEFPYGYKSYLELENREDLRDKFKSEKMVVRRWDKARKLCYASKLAKEAGCDYIMALDADDLLSNKLFDLLAAEANTTPVAGWYMEKGFLYKEGANYFIRVPKDMRFLNGSTHILRSDLVKIPDFSSLDWLDYNLFTDHGWIKARMQKYYGVILRPVPFTALVYVVHGSNISQVLKKEYSFNFKGIVKRILRGVRLSNAIKEEFNIASILLLIAYSYIAFSN